MFKGKKLFSGVCLLAVLLTGGLEARAQSDVLDPNSFLVDAQLYLWNRFSDVLDIVRGGLAGGPGIGAEVAVTNYAQLGAYANYERGVSFPHFVFPLWLVDYYEKNDGAFVYHEGRYATAAFGPWRAERGPQMEGVNRHFTRDRWDIRAQLDAAIIHAYLTVRPLEILDFLAGFVTWDPSADDQRLDFVAVRYPADQFSRGICNILFGVAEVPLNLIRVNLEEGDLPGLAKGAGLGIWRFLCREVVGVVELVTFPFGWQPIIEPDYVFQTGQNAKWRVRRPAFQKMY